MIEVLQGYDTMSCEWFLMFIGPCCIYLQYSWTAYCWRLQQHEPLKCSGLLTQ